MSDTEEEGTFDKEAEREKLRKQLEREEENRRSTQHMSELLLKGATMTNKHCDDCGDPLFRYEGQEFCPTCGQGTGGREESEAQNQQAGAQGGAGGQADATGQSAGIDRVDTGTDEAQVNRSAGSATPDAGGSDESTASAATGQPRTQPRGAARQAGGTATPGASPGAESGTDVGATGDADANVANARVALSRKLATLARQAEATEDVGRSRELLAAAREAAEALAAIDDVGR